MCCPLLSYLTSRVSVLYSIYDHLSGAVFGCLAFLYVILLLLISFFFCGFCVFFCVEFKGGISSRSPCEDTSLAVDLKLMAVDYIAPVALTKSVLPSMLSRRSGHIVVVSSVQGRLAIPFRTSYGGAKHALHGFFESLRAEVADRGVKVTLVLPGYVRTSLSLNAVTGSGQAYAKMDATTAKGMDPAELATKILEAVAMEQDEVLACDLKTKAAIAARALLPGTLSKYMASRAKKGWKELKADPPAT